jgi:hypothetical protein
MELQYEKAAPLQALRLRDSGVPKSISPQSTRLFDDENEIANCQPLTRNRKWSYRSIF